MNKCQTEKLIKQCIIEVLTEWQDQQDVIFKDRQGGQDVYWIDNRDTGGRIYIKPENVRKYIQKGYKVVELEREATQPQEQWKDTFGNKMPGEFTVEATQMNLREMIKECVKEVFIEDLGTPSKVEEEGSLGRYAQQAGAGQFDPRTFGVNEEDKPKTQHTCCQLCGTLLPADKNNDYVKRGYCWKCTNRGNFIAKSMKTKSSFTKEGFDPQSNAGPNPAATEGTQDNPYPAWNDEMRKME